MLLVPPRDGHKVRTLLLLLLLLLISLLMSLLLLLLISPLLLLLASLLMPLPQVLELAPSSRVPCRLLSGGAAGALPFTLEDDALMSAGEAI